MDFLSDELIFARVGEPLEQRLRKSERFRQQTQSLSNTSKEFAENFILSEKDKTLFERMDDAWSEYSSVYGEEAYRMGFEEGVQLAAERTIRVKGSVLSAGDMTHLVYVYDAIKKLNELLLGTWDIHDRECGILEELDRVCDVIESGVCAEMRLLGEDEMHERLEDILDNSEMTSKERAERLVGADGGQAV